MIGNRVTREAGGHWVEVDVGAGVGQIIPSLDGVGHEEGWAGMTCPCGPRLSVCIENGCALIIHQALDGRE